MWLIAALHIIGQITPELRRCPISDTLGGNLSTALTTCLFHKTRDVLTSQLKGLHSHPNLTPNNCSTGQLQQEM